MSEPIHWSAEAKRRFQLQDYGPRPRIDGVTIVELTRFADDGGSMTELARLDDAQPQAAGLGGFTVRQINYSEIEPGAIKAFHLHARQTDVWYVPPSDRCLVILFDVRAGSPTEGVSQRLVLGAGASRLVRIPPGVAHGVRNLGPATARLIYFVDQQFTADPATCDEGRLPWDYLGREIWEATRG
jgi:dTDP-4-dehydrorhamnose 3,5-epimerase-like enzyme